MIPTILQQGGNFFKKDLFYVSALKGGANQNSVKFFHTGSDSNSGGVVVTNLKGKGGSMNSGQAFSAEGFRLEAYIKDGTVTADIITEYQKFLKSAYLEVKINNSELFQRSLSWFAPTINVVGEASQVANLPVNSGGLVEFGELPLNLQELVNFDFTIYHSTLSADINDLIDLKLVLSGTHFNQNVG